LSEDHNFILIADNKKQVTILHNLKIYGGTILQPTNKVAALFRIGPAAQVVALDASAAIATQFKCTQSTANIIVAANTGTNSLCVLQTPTHGDVNYKGIRMFTPAPFLRNAILEAMTPCPFEIIQAAIATHTVFVQENENEDGFNAGDIEAHHNLLITWSLAVSQESIPETCYSLLPDNDDLKKHKVNAHREYIKPTLKAAAAAPVDPFKTVDVLRQLGVTMARSSKAAEAQNTTQQEQLACLKEKDRKKKDKAEKWHSLRCALF
jgi:hypothetical protein